METHLRRMREERRWTQKQVASWMGLSEAQISRLERGGGLTLGRLQQFAKLFNCAPGDLLAGDPGLGRVAVRGFVQAGEWQEAVEVSEQYWTFVTVPVDDRYEGIPRFGLEVRGRSMDNVYPPGTILICVHVEALQEPPADRDRVVVYRYRDGEVEATCKRLVIDDDGTPWLWPDSSDPRHQAPIPTDGDEHVEIVAKVIGSYRAE